MSIESTVRIWDAEDGRELATLRGYIGTREGLAFSPDEQLLRTLNSGLTTRIWDARQETKDIRDRRDALSLVHFLIERIDSEAALRDSISGDETISEAVRELALEYAGPF